jgi:hypothetical protein
VNRDVLVLYGCVALSALSGVALLMLRNPRSFLSRLVDRPVDQNTTREGTR